MSFQCRYGWHCQFMEADLKTPLPRKLQFKSADKVIELVERRGGLTDMESRLSLNQGIMNGRGGVFLNRLRYVSGSCKRYMIRHTSWSASVYSAPSRPMR